MHGSAELKPVDPGKRLEHVDMVRGFALFGVLLVNMANFGSSSIVWTDTVDVAAFSATRFFFETKSWRLFSFLFGFGFALQLLRAEARGIRFLPTFVWRLAILFVFGMANALLYDGDILMYYAELGLVLILFRKVSPKVLLVLVIALLTIFPAQRAARTIIEGPSSPLEAFEVRLERARARQTELLETHPYVTGSIADVMVGNARTIPPNVFGDYYGPESALAFFAMFLLGLYTGRTRILHELARNEKLIHGICRWGIGLGLLGMTIERVLTYTVEYRIFTSHLIPVGPQLLGDFSFVFGSTILALGYAAAVVILSQHDYWHRFVRPLAAVGRMALTIYLLQTLMFSTLFYGYGFGQIGRIGPGAIAGYAVIFFVVQIVVANWWLERFRFGPAEWLWRSLTYRKLQPVRLPAARR